jgi:GNAT superfamily N-acetyltransferase
MISTTMPEVPPTDIRIEAVGFEAIHAIRSMNRVLFGEERVINRFDRPDLIMLLACNDAEPIGFKIGYGMDGGLYYSAKGGVMAPYRRRGVATVLLDQLMDAAAARGYTRFAFDTFPNLHTGMTLLALKQGFIVTEIRYSDIYDDLRVRFSATLCVS